MSMMNAYENHLVCPITYCLFSDPVTAEDGHTYERSAIITWIKRNNTSPLTRETITIEGLRPNHTVKNLVDQFQKDLSKHRYKFKLGYDIERSEKAFFQTTGKCLFDAKWIGNLNGPPIVLLKLYGARAEKEASFYERLSRHPYIIYTYGLVEPPQQTSTFVMLLQEKALDGSLHDFLEHRAEKYPKKILSDLLLNHIFLQITKAMIHLSDQHIIHGDLACRNVLVFRIDEDEPDKTVVKLTDFGISRGNTVGMYSKIDAVTTVIDTVPIRSAAPEVLQGDGIYSEKSDMFAMGVLMWETYANGQIPWEEINQVAAVSAKVLNGERLSRPNNCRSDGQWELILKCMSQNPEDRPTFQELEKQLTEFITINPSILSPSTSITLVNEPEKVTKSLPCSVIIDQTNIENSQEKREVDSSSIPLRVKDRCKLFEKKIEEDQSRTPSPINPSGKSAIPRKELIKLIKWH